MTSDEGLKTSPWLRPFRSWLRADSVLLPVKPGGRPHLRTERAERVGCWQWWSRDRRYRREGEAVSKHRWLSRKGMEVGEYCYSIMMEVAGLWLWRPRFGDLGF